VNTKGLQYEKDELEWLIIRAKPLVLTNKAESEPMFLTVKGYLQGSIKTTAQSITARKAETVASVLLLQSYRLRQDFVEQVSFFQTNCGRFDNIANASQPVALALSICDKLILLYGWAVSFRHLLAAAPSQADHL
jgi:hypothetical protein